MKYFVCLFILAVICSCQDLQSIPGVPQSLICEARNALKDSVPQLQKFSRGCYCRFTLHQKLKKAVEKLQQINKILDVNNLVMGNNNAVKGQNNVIIGESNKINGDDNWLISINKMDAKLDKTLVYKNWEIKMDKIDLILTKPKSVIKVLNAQQKNIWGQCYGCGNPQPQQGGGCRLFCGGGGWLKGGIFGCFRH